MLWQKPILYQGQAQLIDPITRQTYPDANAQNCSDRIKNLFQIDMDHHDFWYPLTTGIMLQDKPAILNSNEVTPFVRQWLMGTQDEGKYTRRDFCGTREKVLVTAASRTTLKKFRQNFLPYAVPQKGSDCFLMVLPEKLKGLTFVKLQSSTRWDRIRWRKNRITIKQYAPPIWAQDFPIINNLSFSKKETLMQRRYSWKLTLYIGEAKGYHGYWLFAKFTSTGRRLENSRLELNNLMTKSEKIKTPNLPNNYYQPIGQLVWHASRSMFSCAARNFNMMSIWSPLQEIFFSVTRPPSTINSLLSFSFFSSQTLDSRILAFFLLPREIVLHQILIWPKDNLYLFFSDSKSDLVAKWSSSKVLLVKFWRRRKMLSSKLFLVNFSLNAKWSSSKFS